MAEKKLVTSTTEENGIVFDDGRIESLAEFLPPEELYLDLIARVRKYHPSDDISLIEKAYEVAGSAHANQMRKSGEPYIVHPLYVAIILADLEMDKETIAAGLLHDVIEDTEWTNEDVTEEFGIDVAHLVDGVTKLDSIQLTQTIGEDKAHDRAEMQAENLRKMFLAMAKDIRVIIIKLADRLHNMRTLKHMQPEKQQRIARETLDIYSPIAQRLGISKIKVELDDLSLKYLEPEVYYDLVDKIAIRKSERERYIQKIVLDVKTNIDNAGIKAEVDGRIKHFFSIYKKMKNQNKTLEEIYDLFAVRIIVDTVKDCYAALGVIHELYKPIPGRFKDYIAMPKPNMYQSIHTTLIGETGQPFEIQIRTWEMHKAAEYGIAAHWKYKEISDGKTGNFGEEEKLTWLRHILEWQRDMSDNKEFMSVLKSDLDLFSDSVYCFTPNGEVKNLPAGSTPIDFAYSIHTAVGNKMVGARVNGRIVNIDYQLANGDKVEIITSQNSKGPSRDWLSICKSSQAKTKINQWFKAELKEENIFRGRELLNAYCKAKSIDPALILIPEYEEKIIYKYGFHDWDAVLAAIGHGGLKEGQIANRMNEFYEADHPKEVTDEEIQKEIESHSDKISAANHKNTSGITVKGVHDLSVRFSKCCNPLPGDEIVGFVTRGRGISIHRSDCINVINMSEVDRARLMDAEWQKESVESGGTYQVEIVIYANNRRGLLVDVSRTLTEKNVNILGVNTRTSKQDIATMQVMFETSGKEEMNKIIDKLSKIPGVIDIER
ncbi:RelA/SpoT family protein [Lacrimispora saccharolytica]|uniref:RelA/SpoT family protein n=1 Tax=Lacrimispora saccharolytica TaxID=84030 RepID=UPI00265CD83A|nr:bifunctional (p)ppGpp synthetase/guanosine-3',5'-bis(diphosphate) 3'-pyrophosphohydrolase [Lacrimispora saccharolytica]MCF2655939.1 bifunctional (p)ppGpp synthetase/guanosine-3',5'-bis(diphosphate) 3'-pyrophosphohydrolase [Lacrimispora saccharolytica]MDY4126271.1 bifunctional (p)ppGpp synthetase/guanosine-3',5'-bis(diphosphate) 3'-pyrophosphohydrolase [Lachnospiraceae bacterium]